MSSLSSKSSFSLLFSRASSNSNSSFMRSFSFARTFSKSFLCCSAESFDSSSLFLKISISCRNSSSLLTLSVSKDVISPWYLFNVCCRAFSVSSSCSFKFPVFILSWAAFVSFSPTSSSNAAPTCSAWCCLISSHNFLSCFSPSVTSFSFDSLSSSRRLLMVLLRSSFIASNSCNWFSSSLFDVTSSSIIADFSVSKFISSRLFSSSWHTSISFIDSPSSSTSLFKFLFFVTSSPIFFLKLIISSISFPSIFVSFCCWRNTSLSLIKVSTSSSKSRLLSSMDSLLFLSLAKSSCSRLLFSLRSTSSCILVRVSAGLSSSFSACFIFRSAMSFNRSWISFSYFSFKRFSFRSSCSSSFIFFSKVSIFSPPLNSPLLSFVFESDISQTFPGSSNWKSFSKRPFTKSGFKVSIYSGNSTFITLSSSGCLSVSTNNSTECSILTGDSEISLCSEISSRSFDSVNARLSVSFSSFWSKSVWEIL